jgi:hypothetical protein
MGTVLGLVFIAIAAAAGVFVGTRSTLIDGRRIAAEMAKGAREPGMTVECDREIRLGAGGAEFVCTHSRLGAFQRIEYRMTREGKYGPVERRRVPAGD